MFSSIVASVKTQQSAILCSVCFAVPVHKPCVAADVWSIFLTNFSSSNSPACGICLHLMFGPLCLAADLSSPYLSAISSTSTATGRHIIFNYEPRPYYTSVHGEPPSSVTTVSLHRIILDLCKPLALFRSLLDYAQARPSYLSYALSRPLRRSQETRPLVQ